MSEESQWPSDPTHRYPPDPPKSNQSNYKKRTASPSPSTAETTQFPRIEDEPYEEAWWPNHSSHKEKPATTNPFQVIKDASTTDTTQIPKVTGDEGVIDSANNNGWVTSSPAVATEEPFDEFQDQWADQEEQSGNRLFTSALLLFVVILLVSALLFAHFTNIIHIPFLGNTSSSSSQNQVPADNHNDSPTNAADPVSDTDDPDAWQLPSDAIPANDSARNNNPAGNFENAYSGSSVTSSELASEVQKAYLAQYQSTKAVEQTLQVTSPVTHQVYEMHCFENKKYVMCTGGNNAVVYIS